MSTEQDRFWLWAFRIAHKTRKQMLKTFRRTQTPAVEDWLAEKLPAIIAETGYSKTEYFIDKTGNKVEVIFQDPH